MDAADEELGGLGRRRAVADVAHAAGAARRVHADGVAAGAELLDLARREARDLAAAHHEAGVAEEHDAGDLVLERRAEALDRVVRHPGALRVAAEEDLCVRARRPARIRKAEENET